MDVWDSDACSLSEGLELVSGHAQDLVHPTAPGPPAPPDPTARPLAKIELARPRASMRYRIER